jgi:hypothetical protein
MAIPAAVRPRTRATSTGHLDTEVRMIGFMPPVAIVARHRSDSKSVYEVADHLGITLSPPEYIGRHRREYVTVEDVCPATPAGFIPSKL